jgi:transposase-like protein
MEVTDGECVMCSAECDGSFMRMNPRYNRVRHMLTGEDIPRFSGGGIALCHMCQRAVYFAGGLIQLLTKDLKVYAQIFASGKNLASRRRRANGPYDIRASRWEDVLRAYSAEKSVADIAREVGINPTTVYEVLRKHGIMTPTEARRSTRAAMILDIFGEDRARKVVEMRRGGQEWGSIAAKMGEKRESVMAVHIALTGGL